MTGEMPIVTAARIEQPYNHLYVGVVEFSVGASVTIRGMSPEEVFVGMQSAGVSEEAIESLRSKK